MDGELDIAEDEVEVSWGLLSWLASSLMVFGGAVPYVPQYQEIQRSGNTEGFSTRVCLVLLVANILRIFFWIGKQFELTLLLQSVVMILTMFAMLHLCCSIQGSNRVSTKQHHISGTVSPYLPAKPSHTASLLVILLRSRSPASTSHQQYLKCLGIVFVIAIKRIYTWQPGCHQGKTHLKAYVGTYRHYSL
ncbi:hypothetical protein ACEWY4_010403 [Coilia grayii]|uniref:Uncharacterized protein n=1 Tax=Coilia grayii TaxID=363190 RepID=A0ABD1K208_9TELE